MELKPCPFCGGGVNWCDCIEGGCDQVECKACCTNFVVNDKPSMAAEKLSELKEKVATVWNTRPLEDAKYKAGMLAAAEIANSQDAPNDALKIRDAIRKVAEETTD